MIVEKIEFMDIDVKEAVITIKKGEYEIICFSCPCLLEEGSFLEEPLECIDTRNVEVCEEYPKIQKDVSSFGYKLQGKIINREDGLVDINGIKIHVDEDEIPNDINNGMYISFETSRVDVW